MTDNMKKFLEAISKNDELTAKVGAMNQDDLLMLARDLGLSLTKADLEKPVQELSDDDLDTVSGGSDVTCVCAIGGGGTKDDDDKTCACVVAGVGYTDEKAERCLCSFAGYGYNS